MKMQGILFAVLIFSLTAAAKPPQTDWDYYQKVGQKSAKWDPLVRAGFEAFDGQNYGAGLSFLKRAMALGCNDGLVLYKLASFQELQGDFKGAVVILKKSEPALRKSYTAHPAAHDLNDHLGGLYFQLEKYEEALAAYLAAIQMEGDNFLRDYLAGQIYRMKGNVSEAVVYFEKSLAFAPPAGSPPAVKLGAKVELLKLYYDTGKNDEALALAEQILAEDPGNPPANSIRNAVQHRRVKEKERGEWKKIIEKY